MVMYINVKIAEHYSSHCHTYVTIAGRWLVGQVGAGRWLVVGVT